MNNSKREPRGEVARTASNDIDTAAHAQARKHEKRMFMIKFKLLGSV